MTEPRTDLKAAPVEDDAERLAQDALIEAQIEAKVQARFAALEAKLMAAAAAGEEASTPPDLETRLREGANDNIKAVLESLSMAFAEISAQGVGVQKPIAPEILRAREEAHKTMVSLIRKAREAGQTPTYRLRSPVYLDEAYVIERWQDSDHVQQPTEIDWPGPPNLAMTPVNDTAKAIYAAFQESIGNMGRAGRAEELAGFNRGLNVKGPKTVQRPEAPPGEFDADPYQGLKVRHKAARGQGRLTHVLGTIAPPALISD